MWDPESLSKLLRVTQLVSNGAGMEIKQLDSRVSALVNCSAEKAEPRTLPEIHKDTQEGIILMPGEWPLDSKAASKSTELFWTIIE